MSDRLTQTLQENLVALVCFDEETAPLIRGSVDLDLFEGYFYDIAERAYDFLDRHKTAAGDHLPDLFDDILESKDKSRARALRSLILDLRGTYDGLNKEYTLTRLDTFIRQQKLKQGIVEAASLLQNSDDPESVAEAEQIITASMKSRLDLFEPGIRITDRRALDFLETKGCDFTLGIDELDRANLGPSRKELHLFVAPPKKGKTWWLVHIGKHGLLQKAKVCHVTLEMSEERMAQRYVQAFFAAAKKKGSYKRQGFELDELGRVVALDEVVTKPKLTFDQKKVRTTLVERFKKWGTRLDGLVIKQFPTGSLTVNQLGAYLDSLEASEQFTPDILIVDYADLMKVDSGNYRISLGQIYKDLRGLAVERNMALVTASQTNREGMSQSQITGANIAEDFSKIATADIVLTYNQTQFERALGLARIHVAHSRNDADQFTVLISQSYPTGQFSLESAPMLSTYNEIIDEMRREKHASSEED